MSQKYITLQHVQVLNQKKSKSSITENPIPGVDMQNSDASSRSLLEMDNLKITALKE